MGQQWATALHHEDAAQSAAGWADAVRTGTVYEAEYRIRSREGKYRWFLARGLPMRDDHGNILSWFGICTDIDDFRRTQRTTPPVPENGGRRAAGRRRRARFQ